MSNINFDDILNSNKIHLTDYLIYRHIRENNGDKIALIYRDKNISYHELAENISSVSFYLKNLNIINSTSPVIIALSDTPAFVITLFSIIACGGTAVLVNPLSSSDEISYMARKVEANMIVADIGIKEKLSTLDWSENILFSGDFYTYSGELEEKSKEYKVVFNTYPSLIFNQYAYVLCSSGTTGKPKAIPRRHKDILYCARAFANDILKMSSKDIVVAVPKLTFGYALGGSLLFSLIYGATCIIFPERTTHIKIAEIMKTNKPTMFLGTPRLISDILKNKENKELESLRIVTSAGEVLSKTILNKWSEVTETPLLDGFGSTEVGHIFLSNKPQDIQPETAGITLNGFETKIINDDGEISNDGVIGKLCIKGPSVANEYLNDAQNTKLSFSNGWHISNDLFKKENGRLIYIGRSDDMIKKGCGEWISPYEIESEVLKHDAIIECAVIGEKNSENVIILKACIVCKEHAEISINIEEEVCKITQEKWPDLPYKHISEIEILDCLPRNNSGKILRHKLSSKTLNEYSYNC
ncbi:AMP-binding protein [Photorhabdus heterorhabditis]|uniref:AMP-binding protein n=1 Tax=Photorhabdus heterorhabditis TaxID=880156 RepID=A0A5B0VRK0_9GAMM|nr:AMP-binding protein [Photorhabdus heterorhabditis]KAA1177322.1 AMP-binding protein [Photorhabdus heterorhabditis]KOY62073.1 hypothetical protein AM629_10630 [Photorhabdus heterorhabditis]